MYQKESGKYYILTKGARQFEIKYRPDRVRKNTRYGPGRGWQLENK